MPAVLTREVDLATFSGEIVVRAYHQGAKNLAVVGTQLDKFTFSLYTKPEIKTPQDLRGKILGVSRFGGSLDISLRYGLQQVGLDPKRDNITLVQAGGMPEIMAGLTAGKLDGAMLLSVYAQRGKELGYRELLDLGTLDVSFPQGVTLTTREFCATNGIWPNDSWRPISTAWRFFSKTRALAKGRWRDSPASKRKNFSTPTTASTRKNI